jgi:hypothetical protein
MQLKDAIHFIKEDFIKELDKDKLRARLAQNMRFERNLAIRLIPLFIKIPIAKLVHNTMSNKTSTMGFSNLGVVQTPDEFKDCIDRFEFSSPATPYSPISSNCITFNDKVVFSLTHRVIDRKFQREIVEIFQKEKVDFYVETNELEVR